MEFLLFTLCLVACFILVFKTKTISNSSLQKKELIVLFTIKILACIALGLVNTYLYNNATDYDTYNNLGKIETDNLLHNTTIFFTDIYKPYLDKYGALFFIDAHFISDLGPNIILKILGFLNLITRENYYCNALFFNSFSFVGCVALYNVFKHIYNTQKTTLIIGCFLLPSTLFFSSGIHKDLFIFCCLCFFCNALYFSFVKGFTTKRNLILYITFVLICMMRLYVGAVLMPLAAIYFICKKYDYSFTKVSIGFFFIFICSTFIVQKLKPSLSPISVLTKKQNEFIQLGKAKTDYDYVTFNNSTKNVLLATPSAVRNAFLSPLPFEFNYLPINIFAAEICIYFLLFILFLFFKKKTDLPKSMFVQFTLLFALGMLIVIGYSITNAGSLIRYRSIYLPFIIIPILCNIDWTQVKQKLNLQS